MYERDGNIYDRREMLRVKIKSLAAEARIIRHEAKRTHGMLKWELNHHRKTIVRDEARASLIAYSLICGRTLSQIERAGSKPVDWDKVTRLCRKYGPIGFEPTAKQQAA